MFSSDLLLNMGFSWLPDALAFLVGAVCAIFSLAVLIRIVKLIVELISFVKNLFGGLLSKVVSWFL